MWFKGSKPCCVKESKGSNFAFCVLSTLQSTASETESAEGRPFAMMAAQGLDVLWIRSSFSLVFFVMAVYGSRNGM